MAVTAAPAAKAMLAEATRLWPKRRTSSDGILPSNAHTIRNPKSSHELGNAVDLSHDPANGCDAHAWAERIMLRRDPRVVYVISKRRIWSVARYDEGWRPYTGDNPHDSHAHFDLNPQLRDDCSPWFISSRPNIPPLHLEDDAMYFADENDRLAWQVEFAYTTLLGRPVESLATLLWRIEQIRTEGFHKLWDDIARSDEAAAREQRLAG